MEEPTRRGFLILAGIGAAAATAGAAVAATATTLTDGSGDDSADAGTPAAAGTLVAYVEDARTGRVSVMVGETEVVVSDPDLVARLARVAGKKA
jgi:hypothetical protein